MRISETAFVVLDTETTGSQPGRDVPIEIACVRVCGDQVGDPVAWFVNPGRKIPPDASAIHHLVDADVADAPRLEELWPQVEQFVEGAVIVAHNAEFDLAMLPALEKRQSLCTLRFARHLWQKGELNPDGFPLTAHQQQVLRYWLGLTVDTKGLAAHRAAADILVTAELLKRQISYYLDCGGDDDIQALFDFIQRPIEISLMPFGKHFGSPLADIEDEYLQYLLEQQKKPIDIDLRASIKRELDRRKAEIVVASRS